MIKFRNLKSHSSRGILDLKCVTVIKVRRYKGMDQCLCGLHGKEFSNLSYVV